MIKKSTVFVLGAGAGFDIGMPLGSTLSGTIGNKLNFRFVRGQLEKGDEVIWGALRHLASYEKINIEECSKSGMGTGPGLQVSRSIDSYLHSHQHNKELQYCGKLAIVQSIFEAERASSLFFDTR